MISLKGVNNMSVVINGEKYSTLKEFMNDENKVDKTIRSQVELEVELIGKLIEARQTRKMSQRTLASLTGVKQPAIARIESLKVIPKVDTLLKILVPLGYKLDIVPIKEDEIKV